MAEEQFPAVWIKGAGGCSPDLTLLLPAVGCAARLEAGESVRNDFDSLLEQGSPKRGREPVDIGRLVSAGQSDPQPRGSWRNGRRADRCHQKSLLFELPGGLHGP